MPQTLLTNAAVTKIALAATDATAIAITHVAIGDGGGANYAPSGAQVALQNEVARVPVSGASLIEGDGWLTRATFGPETPTHDVREIGFFDEDGDLFAIWSGLDVAPRKSGVVTYLVEFLLNFADLSANLVIVRPEGQVIDYPSVAALMNSGEASRSAGAIWRGGDFCYQEMPAGTAKATFAATGGYHVANSAGVLFRVMPCRGEFYLSAFNAVLDRATDDADAVEMLFVAGCGDHGKRLVIDGKAMVRRTIRYDELDAPLSVRGLGWNQSELKTDVDDISILDFDFAGNSVPDIRDYAHDVIFEDFAVTGAWEDNQMQSAQDNWLVKVDDARFFHIRRCRIGSSQKGGVSGWGWAATSLVDCEIYDCARGGWNVSRSRQTWCKGNLFLRLNDDCVSYHTRSGATQFRSDMHSFVDNKLIDCQGVAALGATNILVQGNMCKRLRGRFFVGGYSSSWNEGANTATGIQILDNTVEDIVDVMRLRGTGTYCKLIDIIPHGLTGGDDFAAAPGEPLPGGGVVPFSGNINEVGTGADVMHAGVWALRIAGNTFLKTMAADQLYSANDDGQTMFEPEGDADPMMDELSLRGQWIIGSGMRDVLVESNTTIGFRDLRFFFGNDDGFRRVRFRNNMWQNAYEHVVTYGGASANRFMDVTFDGDTYDGDPLYQNPARGFSVRLDPGTVVAGFEPGDVVAGSVSEATATVWRYSATGGDHILYFRDIANGPFVAGEVISGSDGVATALSDSRDGRDGSWAKFLDHLAFNLVGCQGWSATRCTFKNVSGIYNTSGTNVRHVSDCLQFGRFYSDAFSTKNTGVGRPIAAANCAQIEVQTDSAQPDWGAVVRSSGGRSSAPTDGNYLCGTFVPNTGSSSYTPNAGQLVMGWRRATHCNTNNDNHLVGTDWIEVKSAA